MPQGFRCAAVVEKEYSEVLLNWFSTCHSGTFFGSQRVLLKWLMSASSPVSACIVQQENVTKIMVSLCLEPYFWKKKKVLSAMVRYSKDRSNLDVFVSMFGS